MMQTKYLAVPLALLALALTAAGARAQVSTTGTVVVTIEDQDNARVPGVTVTAAASDTVSKRTTVTDAEGNATLDGLAPSALYTITAQLSGFKDLVRENILVRSGQTTTLRLALSLAGVAESVTVSAASPVVDTTNSTTGQDITLQLTEALPTGRSYQSYLQLVPGVLPDNPVTPGNPAAKSGLNYADIDGEAGVSRDNFYYLDGINVTDPVTGTFGANMNTEVIQEQHVITGGIPAEFVGAPGLISNVVTKSGSNTIHGTANYFFQNTDLVADNKHGAAEDFSIKDTAFTFGGPVVRDKVWGFGSYRFLKRDDNVSTLDTNQFLRTVGNDQKQGFAKGTFAPTLSDTITFSYLGDPTDISGRRERDITNERDRSRIQGGHRWAANYSRTWAGMLLEVGGNKHNGEVSDFSVIRQKENTVIWRAGTPHTLKDEQLGGFGQDVVDQRDTSQVRGSLQWAWQRHVFKGGVEFSRHENFRNSTIIDNERYFSLENGLSGTTAAGIASGSFTQRNFISTNTSDFGGLINTINARADRARFYSLLDLDGNGTITAAELGQALVFNSTAGNPSGKVNYSRIFQSQDGPQETRSDGLSFYVQDTLPIGRVTINAGVRTERWAHFATTGDKIFTFPWEVAPRVSVTYDVNGDGRQKVSGYYGIYFDPVRNNMTNFAGTLTGAIRNEQVFVGGEWVTYRIRGGPVQQDAFFTPSTQTPYTDDLQLGYERDLGRNMSVSATFSKRRTRDILEDYDHNLYADPASYPGPSGNPPATAATLNAPDTLFLGPGYFGYTTLPRANFVISTLAGGKRDWKGVELVFRKRYQNGFQFLGSYDWQDANGNTNSDSNADFQGDVLYLDPRAPNQYGVQPGLVRHLVKGSTSYLFKFGLQLGGTLRWNSGSIGSLTELQSRRNLPIQVAAGQEFVFAGIRDRWLAPGAVGGFENPSYGSADVRVEYVKQVQRAKFELFMDVFDLFNNQSAVRKQDLVAGRGANPFNSEILWLQPRRAFFGIRVGI
jgi:Carboxypeptidase regulatory-like domain